MTTAGDVEEPRERRLRPRILRQITDWEPLIVQSGYCGPALARLCGVSLRHLQRHVKAAYHRTLSALLDTVRLQKAHQMLCGGCAVKEAAFNFGYKQVSHFSRNFRRHFGANASEVLIRACLGDEAADLRLASRGKGHRP